MAKFLGDQSQTSMFYESGTYASTSGVAHWFGGVTSHEADESMGVISQRYVGQLDRNVSQFLDGPQTFNNTLTMQVQDFRFMKFVLGSAVDGGSPTPYLHNYAETNNNAQTLEVPNTSLPSFTIEDAQRGPTTGSNFIRTFKGGMVDTLTLTIAEREPVVAELGYAAQSVTFGSGAISSVTQDTTRPYMWRDVNLHLTSGNVIPNVKEIVVEVANNLDQPHYVDGNRTIGTPLPTMRDYTITLTLNADDTNHPTTKAWYDQYFIGGSQFNMLLDMSITAATEQGIWTFSGCKIEDMTAPSPNEGVNEQTIVIRPTSSSFIEHNNIQYINGWSGAGL